MHLAELIDLIYQGELTFEKCEEEVQDCLEALLGGDKFHGFVNQAIRIHVNVGLANSERAEGDLGLHAEHNPGEPLREIR